MDINLVSPINSLGYGAVGYNVLKALTKQGHSVALFPIGNPQWPTSEESNKIISDARQRSVLFNKDASSIRIWHQFELDMFPGGGPKIGWPIFELDSFTDREKHHIASLDAVFVCSDWAKEIVEKINPRVFTIPLGVDPELFYYDEAGLSTRQYWNKNTTVFLNVGKWEVRKGHDELCAAFNAAFKPSDDVELWMMCDNPFLGPDGNYEWRKKFAASTMGSNVKFFDRVGAHGELRKIYAQVDCIVSPSHAEGWGLPTLEAMACGAHVIATNYAGHTQFLNKNNSFLLDVTGKEIANDGKWFHGQGAWCSFSIEQLVEHMRMVHELKQSGQLKPNVAGIENAKTFSWNNSANDIISALAMINNTRLAACTVGV